jgi:hypothetical protein
MESNKGRLTLFHNGRLRDVDVVHCNRFVATVLAGLSRRAVAGAMRPASSWSQFCAKWKVLIRNPLYVHGFTVP